tara:strand:+ start:1268 stop:1402 length:135 start_codon:yes stop_codon:yes gene_type:complete
MNIQDITNLTPEIISVIIIVIIVANMIKDKYPFNIRRKKNEDSN